MPRGKQGLSLSQLDWVALFAQSAAILLAVLCAWLLRFDFALPQSVLLAAAAPVLLAARWVSLLGYRLHHAYWRYTGLADLGDLAMAIAVGSVLFVAILHFTPGTTGFPISIYLLEAILSFLFLAGMRIAARILIQIRIRNRSGRRKRVLIVGAGSATAMLLHELHKTNYIAIGLVDDNIKKHNTKVCGVPVLGSIDQLPAIADRHFVSEILIAIPSATGKQLTRITNICSRASVPFRITPSLSDLIEGKLAISELRRVNLDDLLGREPVRFESEDVRQMIESRAVMVTGAAGSIGSELCRQIVRYFPGKLICVDQAETPLFNLQQQTLANSKIDIHYSVADIRDTARIRRLIVDHDVKVIFHAAAYKHVPMTEANAYEGLRNNVFALLDLVETADQCGCDDFVLISSDKAVKPSSLMGCTKRLGEMIVGSRQHSRMRCVCVRFGNVLGSQGSVVPLFQEQIRTRGPITVTHPEMTRYFMTVPEAVSLVLNAFTVGEHGDILVLDMGKPIRIVDIARTLIRISGKKESDIEIVFTGMRPGEKLHEELFYDSERRVTTSLSRVIRAQSHLTSRSVLMRHLEELEQIASGDDPDWIREKIKQIIPEYQWQRTEEPKIAASPDATFVPVHFNPRFSRSKFA